MTGFDLMRVSGAGMLERHMRWREVYSDYVRRTSTFFPRPPRS
jgi:steroid 5-alpha reductase family enzyme